MSSTLKPTDGLCITAENEREWLARKAHGIGSSDAASVAGVGWLTPIQVWQQKLGLAPPTPLSDEMKWGKKLEPLVAREYTETTGHSLVQQVEFTHPEYPWMTATLDGFRMDGRIVELKTASQWARDWGEEGTDQIPEPYLVQVHHQMMVTGAREADVALLLGGSSFRIYPVVRDEGLIDALLDAERRFWLCLQRKIPPLWGKLDARSLAILNPHCHGEIALVERDVIQAHRLHEDTVYAIKRLTEIQEEAKLVVLAAMNNAEFGLLPDGRKIKRFRVEVPEALPTKPRKAHVKHYFTTLKAQGDGRCVQAMEAQSASATSMPAIPTEQAPS